MPYYRNMYTNTPEMTMPYTTCGSMHPYALIPSAPVVQPGLPAGTSPAPQTPAMPAVSTIPGTTTGQPIPQTLQSTAYIPGFLKTHIGRRIRIEFLIGTTGPLIDRSGTLLGVGASYVTIRPFASDDTMLCDLFSIKFVTILA